MTVRTMHSHGKHAAFSIHIGGVYASAEPALIRTILGSCIAVCLYDPQARVGGMNHFMLPDGFKGDEACPRFGVHAMELLINACMKHGADRRLMEAKVFGGGHVLNVKESAGNVPQANIAFAESFLQTEKIPIVARDLGGYTAREIRFQTDTGKAMLKRLPRTVVAEPRIVTLAESERAELRRLREISRAARRAALDDSNVDLFT